MQELKLTDAPSQTFETRLEDQRATFTFKFNTVSQRWTFDLLINNQIVLQGRKLILDINVVMPYVHFDIGVLFCTDPERKGNLPDRFNIPGGLVRIFTIPKEELSGVLNDTTV